MFNFNLEKATIYQAVKWNQFPFFRFAGVLKGIFLILLIFSSLIFFLEFLTEDFRSKSLSISFTFSKIFLTFFIAFWQIEIFFNSKLKRPKLRWSIEEALFKPEDFNLAEFLSFEVAKVVIHSLKLAKSKKLGKVNSSLLFYFLLTDNPKLNFIFSRGLLNLSEIRQRVFSSLFDPNLSFPSQFGEKTLTNLYSLDFQETILEALKIAQKRKHQKIEIYDLLIALAKSNFFFQKILIEANLKIEDIENLTDWLETLEKRSEERKKFWEMKNLRRRKTLAKEWTAGYTPTLDLFSTDLSEIVRKHDFPEIVGHQKEIEQMERILSRKEIEQEVGTVSPREINNVLLVGEAGSGRKSMVYALAIKSLLGESFPQINYKRIVQLDLPSLVTKIDTIEKTEEILDTIFRETVSAGNIILVIDEIHKFIGSSSQPGKIDISGIISPYLVLPQFQVIAITTFEDLHKYLEQNSSFLALFEKVEVSEISEKETLVLLENLALIWEKKYKKFISYPAILAIINLSARYLPAIPFPEKAIDLLDEAVVYLCQTREKILLPSHVAKIIKERTQIPVGEIETKEREILLNLENLIHRRIINQEEAVREISTALRRARAEVTIRKGPMGTFLFLGPTGVGKTETSKALAEIYFGSEERMIRLDMSEFQDIKDIPRLIGSPGQEGLLTTPVRENPFSLILLDELEKAHPNILNLFLQVLDEGHLTDGLGRKIDFKNSIIIATSNAGYQIILAALKEKTDWAKVKEKLLDFLFSQGIFRPEFINRFDGVVVFKPLTKENLLDIAELMLQSLKKNLKEKGIEFIISQPLKEKIVELGYDPTFGARQMRRTIQERVENILAQALLAGEIKRGQKVEITPDFKIKIHSLI